MTEAARGSSLGHNYTMRDGLTVEDVAQKGDGVAEESHQKVGHGQVSDKYVGGGVEPLVLHHHGKHTRVA